MKTKFAILMLLCLFLAGCEETITETGEVKGVEVYDLSNQDLKTNPQAGLSKVIFFNNVSLAHSVDRTGTIAIRLNGKGLATLKASSYVQVFLEKGQYDLYMEHWDLFVFKSNHKLQIDKNEVFIEVSPSLTSNEYKILDQLPAGFEEKYKPAYTSQ